MVSACWSWLHVGINQGDLKILLPEPFPRESEFMGPGPGLGIRI